MITDDDIQYLGTRHGGLGLTPDVPVFQTCAFTPLQRTPSTSTTERDNRPLAGVVLHVERSGKEDEYDLTFSRKFSGSTIQIGRPQTPGGIGGGAVDRRSQPGSGRAWFRCPVVSRMHAKLVLDVSGVR